MVEYVEHLHLKIELHVVADGRHLVEGSVSIGEAGTGYVVPGYAVQQVRVKRVIAALVCLPSVCCAACCSATPQPSGIPDTGIEPMRCCAAPAGQNAAWMERAWRRNKRVANRCVPAAKTRVGAIER